MLLEYSWDDGSGENKFINILCQSNQLLFAKLVMFAIETGMTKNELKKINTDKDLNGRYLTIYRSKNKKFRTKFRASTSCRSWCVTFSCAVKWRIS